MATYSKNKTPKKSRKRLLLILVIVLLVVAGVGYAFIRPKTGNSKTTETQTGTAIADANVPGSEDKSSDTNSVTPGAISGPSNSKDIGANTPGQISSDTQPNKPIGQFVSNEGSNEAPASLAAGQESTCTTTPGAYCEIRFTSGSTTKKLSAQKTNAEGNTIWDWTPKNLLTAGTWQVTAVAINGDKTASTSGPQLVLR